MTAVLALLLAGCGGQSAGSDGPVANVSVHDDDGINGVVLPRPYEIPSVPLDDADGATYDLAKDATKPLTLVFFGYTHCPDICGIVMGNLAAAMTRLSAADRARVDVVYVTTDPARDTEQVLAHYLDRLDPDFLGLTGDLGDIVALARPLGVGITQGRRLPSGGYDVTHGTTVTAIDARDEAPAYWPQETSAAQYADDLHTLLTEKN